MKASKNSLLHPNTTPTSHDKSPLAPGIVLTGLWHCIESAVEFLGSDASTTHVFFFFFYISINVAIVIIHG